MLIDMFSSAQKESDTCQLQCVRRVGPIGCDGQHIAALWYPDSRRDAARAPSTGGKDRLGSISKQGDRYLRRLLVVAATSVINSARARPYKYPWVIELLGRRPTKVVAVALANKMARIAWAVLAKGEPYRAPTCSSNAVVPAAA